MRILTTTLFIVGLMAIAAVGQTTEDPTLRDPERRVSKDVKKSVPYLGEIPLLGSFFQGQFTALPQWSASLVGSRSHVGKGSGSVLVPVSSWRIAMTSRT